jgi:glycine dehydrogenase subunit 2
MVETTIYEKSIEGRVGVRVPLPDVPKSKMPAALLRKELPLPELSELDVSRHFTRISQLNHSISTGFYPLGSCTMKFNPTINEETARIPAFLHSHPMQPTEMMQGNLAIMYFLQEWLSEIGGFTATSLQPAAGAQGELAGVLMIRAYHADRGDNKRNKILVPDSAHGTNPATSSMSGYRVVEIPSDKRGNLDLELLKQECDDELAGLMLTNPNTLGLFEEHVIEVIEAVHAAGGLVYGDGANMNATLGIVKPGELGIDVMHYNLHKTFTTPHGGGGPGSGPVSVVERLKPFLPGPISGIVEEGQEDQAPLYGWVQPEKSIGRLKAFHGQFGMMVRAFTYILMQGSAGLRRVSEHAVLNANYIAVKLKKDYTIPFDRITMHEVVLEGRWKDIEDVHALDISKRLMDFGLHPPTNYFPLIVREALMIEPTETESKQTLDFFIDAMKQIAKEARENPEILRSAPHETPFGRLDEVQAAKQLVLCCEFPKQVEV